MTLPCGLGMLAGNIAGAIFTIMLSLALVPIEWITYKRLIAAYDSLGNLLRPKWAIEAGVSAVLEAVDLVMNVLLLLYTLSLISQLEQGGW